MLADVKSKVKIADAAGRIVALLVCLVLAACGTTGGVDTAGPGAVSGLPVMSLYGATRRPTPEMLEGLDAVAFTGGIGENSALIRHKVCTGMGWIGIEIDEDANAANATVISSDLSRVRVLVVPTNEELVIARAAAASVTRIITPAMASFIASSFRETAIKAPAIAPSAAGIPTRNPDPKSITFFW